MVSPFQKHSLKRAYLAWFTCALFFFYQYLLRVAPGVMVAELREQFALTAMEFATFGAYYLYAYSLLQIPLGALVDRLGIRRMVLISIGLCIAGTLLFAHSPTLFVAQLSRIMVGAGSATAFMCSLKIIADYFPAGKRGLLMGLTLTLGTIGALTAGKPLVIFLEDIGWRDTVSFSAFIGAPIALMSVFLLPNKQHISGKQNTSELIQHTWTEFGRRLTSILKNPMIMLYTLLAIGLYTPLSALADLWGTSFLMQKFDLTRGDAAQTSMMMYLGMAVGSLIMPWYFEKKDRLNQGIQLCGVVLFILMGVILYGPPMGLGMLTLVLLALGVFCGGEMMCFTGTVSYTIPQMSGLTLGVVNTLNMLGGAFLQQLIGFGLDWQWSGVMDGSNLRLYSTTEFIFALSSLLVVIGICIVASFGLRNQKA